MEVHFKIFYFQCSAFIIDSLHKVDLIENSPKTVLKMLLIIIIIKVNPLVVCLHNIFLLLQTEISVFMGLNICFINCINLKMGNKHMSSLYNEESAIETILDVCINICLVF